MDIFTNNDNIHHRTSSHQSDSERFQRDCEWFYLVFWIFILENAVILAILIVCCFVPIVRAFRVGWSVEGNSENEFENVKESNRVKSYFSSDHDNWAFFTITGTAKPGPVTELKIIIWLRYIFTGGYGWGGSMYLRCQACSFSYHY